MIYGKRVIILIMFMLFITCISAFNLREMIKPDKTEEKSCSKYLTINAEAEIYTWQWGDRERKYLWCSFPRIDTGSKLNLGQSRDVDTELEEWNINPAGMMIFYLNMMFAKAEYEKACGGWMWVPDALWITSKYGYKIRKSHGEHSVLLKRGNLCPPNALLEISRGGESWIGYFPEKSQSVRTAFPEEVLADALYIKTMNWAVSRNSFSEPWSGDLDNSILNYANCVVIYTRNNHTFAWGKPPDDSVPKYRPVAEHFTFSDDIDYIPVYAEFDENEMPDEVAIFVNDICRGAQVVEDTICQICSFILEEEQGQEIEFAFWYEGRNAVERKSIYKVYNEESDTYEQRSLITGMPGIHYKVSFKGNMEEIVPTQYNLQCYPNPFNPELTISFSLEETQDVKLEVYNLRGQKVRSLANETFRSDSYNVIWSGDDNSGSKVSSGVYFIRLQVGDEIVNDKVILMK